MPHHSLQLFALGLATSIAIALGASIALAAPPIAKPIVPVAVPPVGGVGAGPDVFGGYASDHIVIQVKPGIAPYKMKSGAWTLATNAANARATALSNALTRRNVSSIKLAMKRPAKNRALASQLGLDRYYIVNVPPRSDAPAIVAELAAFNDTIESAQLDGIGGIAAQTIPNDTDFIQQWNMHNTGQGGGVADADIDAPEAWNLHQGSNSITLAILDTGVQHFDSNVAGSFDHPDLPGGRILQGFSTWSNTANTEDLHGHGTHTTGIAAANGNDGVGVCGMNWNCKILPVQCVNPSTGSGTETQCADAIYWAVDDGFADVISMSLQYYTGNTYLRDAVAYAYNEGVLPIAATGNFHGAVVAYPAKWPKCMAVGATNKSDLKYSGSNTGPEIDVVAPGELVYSAWKNSGYAVQSGTSMATPHVGGLAALMLSFNPSLTPAQIEAAIIATAEDKGPVGFDQEYGHGRINARAALFSIALAIPGDITGNFKVDVDDLLAVINSWGPCPPLPAKCPADLVVTSNVNIDDLLFVINHWGP